MDCPVCGKKDIEGKICPQCNTDLIPLIRLKSFSENYIKKENEKPGFSKILLDSVAIISFILGLIFSPLKNTFF